MSGPLTGLRVVELQGQGPGPYGGMLLADMGCDVVCVDRPSERRERTEPARNPMMRGKRSVVADLKTPEGAAAVRALTDAADVFIDPFRPGVCERLGIGPEVLCASNPRLIYARMTGFGQDGPWANAAGHDINYISLGGALDMIGAEGLAPQIPVNLVADFGGGGVMLVVGVAAAAYERERSGRGQVIDVAMVDGTALLLGPYFMARESGAWGPRGTNHLDGAAPFYNVYETLDGRWISVGAIEPQFHAAFYRGLGLEEPSQWDRAVWRAGRDVVAARVRTRTRDEWMEIFDGAEACVAPVLAPTELPDHPHTAARSTTIRIDDVLQPAPAPRFSRTASEAGRAVHPGTSELDAVLAGWSAGT